MTSPRKVRRRVRLHAAWRDREVQLVYTLLCADEIPPHGQHWEGWMARRIVAELRARKLRRG